MQFLSNDDGLQIGLAPEDLQKLTHESMVHGSVDLPGWPILYRVAISEAADWDVHFDGHAFVVNVPRQLAQSFIADGGGPLQTQVGSLPVRIAKL